MMRLLVDRPLYRTVSFAAVLIFCLLCVAIPLSHPVDNWDMLGYAASVKSLYGMDAASIHASVFAEYKSYATLQNIENITNGSSYRRVMHQDADAFYQQIPFYKIRVFYVMMLAAATELGFNIYSTMHFLSGFFAAAAFLVVYLGLRSQLHSLVWIVAPIFYYNLSLQFSIFQKGGVDSFSFFWVAITTVLFIRRSKWVYPLLALSVLVRTDLIIFAALLFAVSLYWHRREWRQIIFFGLATLVAYFSVNTWSENFGWTTLINFVFVSEMLATHPEQYSQNDLKLDQYMSLIFNPQDWISKWFWLAIGISILNLAIYIASFRWSWLQRKTTDLQMQNTRRLQIVSTVFLVYIALHYLLFPAIFMRFFYGQCFLCAIALLAAISAMADSNQEQVFPLRDRNTANR